MTPQRWRQIDALLEKAHDKPPEEFEALLAESCIGDESLRREVESLISYRKLAENFLEVPALEATADLISEYPSETIVGLRIGPYRIESKLGTGGMAEVYLAEDTKLDRKVAIKFLPVDFETDELARKRLIREAKAAAKLDHPNICAIHEIAEVDGRSFIVMQYVEGETLASRLERQVLEPQEASEIASQVADALAEAHSRGIIHRDIKPQNVMITPRGQVKVLDFGLAKLFEVEDRGPIDRSAEMLLSVPGLIVGTAYYMSPEQARGLTVDARADLFSLGVMMYECVTGKRPFTGESGMEIRAQVIHVHPKPPSRLNPSVPSVLDGVILKALAKEPNSRYQSAGELLKDLQHLHTPAQAEDDIKTQPIPEPHPAGKSALTSMSAALQRPQVWIPLVVVLVVVAVALTVVPGLRKAPHVPSPEATYWYRAGTGSLRNGAYYQASKALQEAVAKDDKFALAHARLAEAYTELDYSDKASHEILRARALVNDNSSLPKLDSLYLQAITNTVLREYPSAIEGYKEIAAMVPDAEKPQALVDLGRAYEKDGKAKEAKESYQKALQLSSSDAAASLRLAVICGQLQDLKCADESFDRAEKLYTSLSSQEGLSEVYLQRGYLLKILEKPADARIQLEKALELSKMTGSVYQQIRVLLSLSSVAAWEARPTEAQQRAHEATSLARASGMENQATAGLILTGNYYLHSGEYSEAEKYYQLALELARRDNGRRNENLALVQLGSLRLQQHNTVEGKRYIDQALPFFQQQGYRKELSDALTLRARGLRNNGDSESALNTFTELLQVGEAAQDASQVASAHEEIGSVLTGREDYIAALQHFDESYKLNQSLKALDNVGYLAMQRAAVLWQLGRYDEAGDALTEAVKIAEDPNGGSNHLLATIATVRGQMETSKGNWPEARAQSLKVLSLAGSHYTTMIISAKLNLGLVQARTGARRGASLCNEALDLAVHTSDPMVVATARLACSEMMLANGEAQVALERALQAQEAFSQAGRLDSEWRAAVIAARATQKLGNEERAREFASKAKDSFARLEQRLGPEGSRGYLSRKDIQNFQQQLNQLSSPKGE
jgi:serine/threonine protein kinase/Tfp pilus assembly protein PilF